MQSGLKTFISDTPDFFDQKLPAAIFGVFAIIAVKNTIVFAGTPHDVSSMGQINYWLTLFYYFLTTIFTIQNTIFFLIRKPKKSKAATKLERLIAFSGTFIVWVILANPNTVSSPYAILMADLITSVGLMFAIYALSHLRLYFGISPEARGFVMTGPYKWIRHPMYLGEFIAFFGILIPKLSLFAFSIFVIFIILQCTRAMFEERVLSKTFSEYHQYRKKTPPFLPRIKSK
jgi:protein-S-isoprenylcysteine O-methyltransferase Ste14